ncbi:MAG: DUF4832 domain-containing protein [Pseudomonadota bacterium]
MQTITFSGTNEDFANPERGFFSSKEPNFQTNESGAALNAADLSAWGAANNTTLVKKNFILADYLDSDLSDGFLEMLVSDMENVEQAGFKLIPRFTYNWNPAFGTEDAPLEETLAHIAQLEQVFAAHEDVIDHIQGGFIGRWGEGHTSSEGHVEELSTVLAESGIQIFDALADAAPDDMTVALRYPRQIEQMIESAVSETEATDGEGGGLIGYMNDGLFNDPTHFGSLDSDVAAREAQLDYISEVSEFTATSGEPAVSGDTDFALSIDAVALLDRLNFNALSLEQGDAEKAGLYDHWRESGEFAEISKGLGYRFELRELRIPETVTVKGRLALQFDVENADFARAHNERPVEIVLRDPNGQTFTVETGIDARSWDDGKVTTVQIDAVLPDGMTPGNYEVLLSLPDPSDELDDRPEYAIRLANEGVWEAETGYNALGVSVTVTPADGGVSAEPGPMPVEPTPAEPPVVAEEPVPVDPAPTEPTPTDGAGFTATLLDASTDTRLGVIEDGGGGVHRRRGPGEPDRVGGER